MRFEDEPDPGEHFYYVEVRLKAASPGADGRALWKFAGGAGRFCVVEPNLG